MQKKKGLGRGLDALFGQMDVTLDTSTSGYQFKMVPWDSLVASPFQARKVIDQEELLNLASSIREQGLLNPIVVRLTSMGDHEIVAGERRWRACQLAGLSEVPVLIRSFTDEESMMLGLLENLQRKDLNPIDEAEGLHRLIEEFGVTHEQVAKTLGRDRSTITNTLRLLALPEKVKDMVRSGVLSMGHARSLLPLSPAQQIMMAEEVVAKLLTVRQTEQRVKELLEGVKPKVARQKSADDKALETRLAERLGASVSLSANKKGKGKLVISFSSLDQLQGILAQIER